MEDAIASLNSASRQARIDTLEGLRAKFKAQPTRLQQLHPESALIVTLKKCLADGNWNVRRETIALVADIMARRPQVGINLAPALFSNLADAKVSIRKTTASAIVAWIANSEKSAAVADAFAKQGLQCNDDRIILESIAILNKASVRDCIPLPLANSVS